MGRESRVRKMKIEKMEGKRSERESRLKDWRKKVEEEN